MSVASDLYDSLNANAGVRALIGVASSPQEIRCYPRGNVPEDAAKPFLAYFMISDIPISTVKGVSDIGNQRIQINCCSDTYDGSLALADAVESALEGNGYLLLRYEQYDEQTRTHLTYIDWGFMS